MMKLRMIRLTIQQDDQTRVVTSHGFEEMRISINRRRSSMINRLKPTLTSKKVIRMEMRAARREYLRFLQYTSLWNPSYNIEGRK